MSEDDHAKGGDEEKEGGEGHPAARAQGHVLTAEHDAEHREKEGHHKERPEGGMEALTQHGYKADTEAKQKSVGARGDGEEEHLQDTSIEVIGCRLGATAHIW